MKVKRFLIYIAAFAAFGGLFAYLLKTKSTYVLLSYESHAFESSLWFFLVALVLGYFLLNVVLKLVFSFYRPGQKFNSWAASRRAEASKRDFYQSLLDFEKGDWEKALKKFQLSAKHIERPCVAYLYAAKAAQKAGRSDIREEMLHEAAQAEPKSSVAIGLVRAELLLEDGHSVEAAKVLQGLKKLAPNNLQVKGLLENLPASAVEPSPI